MFERYKIKKGDTISLIARQHGVSKEYLKSINDIYFLDNIREGQDLIVPKSVEKYYNVEICKKSGSIKDIAREYNVNPKLFVYINGLNTDDYIYINQEILLPKENYSYYITSEGDTVKTTAEIFNISRDRLLSQNDTIYLLKDQIIVNKKLI